LTEQLTIPGEMFWPKQIPRVVENLALIKVQKNKRYK
jgi:hypothetical protein